MVQVEGALSDEGVPVGGESLEVEAPTEENTPADTADLVPFEAIAPFGGTLPDDTISNEASRVDCFGVGEGGVRDSSSHRGSGRKPAARAYDALIAATAIANGLPLFTCNPQDFEGIEGLDVRAVPLA